MGSIAYNGSDYFRPLKVWIHNFFRALLIVEYRKMLNKFYRQRPLLARFVFFVITPVLACGVFLFTYLLKSVPEHEGELFLDGVSASVYINRDEDGVAHIDAASDLDAYFALGYLHAQQRLWQMEFNRRLGAGRLSEIFGRTALASDQLMRTLGLYKSAARALENLNETERQHLDVYVEGINAWIKQAEYLPVEFQMLDFRPELWTPEDSLLQVKLLGLELSGNYKQELAYDLVARKHSGALADLVFHNEVNEPRSGVVARRSSGPVDLASGLLSLSLDLEQRFGFGGEFTGSNAWVVAGRFTRSGLPMLANDPHLKMKIPSIWYLAELKGDRLWVSGATIPGLPLVIFGRNRHFAWGGTNPDADVQDLFLEQINSQNGNLYRVGDQWHALEVEQQWIKVKADFPAFLRSENSPVRWDVRSSRHGPLISDAIGRTDKPMALSWTGLSEDDTSFSSFYQLNRAESEEEFDQALAQHIAPVLTILYADINGNIGERIVGRIPIRASGKGRFPVEGWTGKSEWVGFVPPEQLPQSKNPAKGYLVSANDQTYENSYPHLISNNWKPSYRADRIKWLLQTKISAGKKFSASDFQAIQGDYKDLQAEEMRQFISSLKPLNARQEQALAYLGRWDQSMSSDSVAATIYHTWLRHFAFLILEDDLRADLLYIHQGAMLQDIARVVRPELLKLIVGGQQEKWCDRNDTPNVETCADIGLLALDEAIAELTRFAGSRMSKWQWGEVNSTMNLHLMFAQSNMLKQVFNREISAGGSQYTVNMGAGYFLKDKGYHQIYGPTYRQINDLKSLEDNLFISNTGQSGNVMSRGYDNYVEPHRNMKYFRMFSSQKSSAKVDVLVLHPSDRSLTSTGSTR